MNKESKKENKDNLFSEKTEIQFNDFFESAADAMFIAETHTGIIVEANLAASRLLLLPRERIIGLHQSQLHTKGNKGNNTEGFTKHEQETKEMAAAHLTTGNIIRSDGSEIPVEILASKITYKGKLCLIGTFRDITERKKTEEAFIESREQFRSLSEEVPAFISSFLPDGTIIYCNQALASMTGKSVEEITGKNFYNFLNKEDLKIVKSSLKSLTPENPTENHVQSYTTPEGKTFYQEWRNRAFFDKKGKTLRYLAIGVDVTQSKEIENALRESEKKYRLLFDSSPIGIGIADLDGKVIAMNNTMQEITGFTIEEMKKRNVLDSYIYPEERERIKKDLIALGEIKDREAHLKRKDGAAYFALINLNLIELGGRKLMLSNIRDITELKQTYNEINLKEERFNQIADSSGIWVWETDKDGLFTYVSSTEESILGYKPEETVGKKHFYDFFAPEIKESYKSAALDAFSRKDVISNFVNPNIHKNGKRVILETSGVPILDEKGNLTGYRGADKDITERENAAGMLRSSEEKFSVAFKNIPVLLSISESNTGKYIDVNDKFLAVSGFSREEVIGKTSTEIGWISKEDRELLINTLKDKGRVNELELHLSKKNKEEITCLYNGETMMLNGEKYLLSMALDITERKKAEQEIENLNRVYSVISHINEMIVRTESKDELFRKACEIAVEQGKFRMSWIGLVDEKDKLVKPNTWSGHEDGYLKEIRNISILGNFAEGLGPTGIAVREGRTFHCDDIENNPLMAPWREKALKRGYRSSISLPLRLFGKMIGAFTLYADTPEFFDDKEVELLEKVADDISYALETIENKEAKKQTEEELNRSHEMLLKLTSQVPGVVYQYRLYPDGHSCFPFSSPGMYEIYEVTPEEVREDATPVFGRLHPDDLEMITFTIMESARTQEVYHSDFRVILPEQGLRWRSCDAKPELMEDGSTLWYGVISDITERKNAEAEIIKSQYMLAEAENIGQTGSWTYDAKTEIAQWSSNMYKIFDTDHNDTEILDYFNFIDKFIHPEDKKLVLEEFTKALKDKDYLYDINYRIKRRDGSTRIIHAVAKTIWEEDGTLRQMIGWVEDITKQKQEEEELILAKEKAEEMSRLKSNFLANMSHELRTPMVAILGFSEILSDSLKESEEKRFAEMILKGGRRLTNTLNLILDLSRVESTKIEFKLEPQNISGTIESSVKLYEKEAEKKKVKLTSDIKGVVTANIDISMLEKILEHIIENALKYTPEGEIKVTAEHESFNGEEYICIKIKDTGIGIPENMAEIIFEPFRQASEGRSRRFEGTGLGLSIAKKYVELMDGIICVESKLGEGTTFILRFRSCATPDAGIYHKEDIIKNENKRKQSGSKTARKILIVEDDELSLDMIKQALKNMCVCDSVTTGEEALEIVHENNYSLILMDIGLKGISGSDAAAIIRKIHGYKTTPIVAITAFAMKGDKEEFIEKGCSHYISKPFDVIVLRNMVKEALGD
ncbi:MAG: PAS domain S-box protein [Ignavibacteriota bacterium]